MTEEVVEVNKFITYKEKYLITTYSLPEFIQELGEMEVREDDIFVVTYPKSGTHWMQEIVQLILVDGHEDRHDSSSHRNVVIEIADVAQPTPERLAASGPILRQMKNAPSPRVLATHVQYPLLPKQIQEKKCKVVYVYRHPKDVITSDFNFCRKLYKLECGREAPDTPENFAMFFNDAINGKIAYGSWMDHVLQYSQEIDNECFLFVSFESMKADLASVVKNLAFFIGHPLDEEAVRRVVQAASIRSMRTSFAKEKEETQKGNDIKKLDPTIFVNKGKVGQWKDRFTVGQNEYFDSQFEIKMKNCDLVKAYNPVENGST